MAVAPEHSGSAPAKGKAPLGIVKRNDEEFEAWLATERGFLAAFGSFQDEPIQLDKYQIRFLNSKDYYRCVEKSRQVGYSWVFACEAIARSHLRDMHTSIFVSYNLADAKEKIAYCQQLHEDLPLEYQKKKVVDSKLEIGFQSNGAQKRVSRIISNPSKAPRGKKGDIYLDELAHCANDREIYAGSTALILRSQGQLSICSSPLGRRGVFWEIARQEVRPYRAYWRQRVPWWLCRFFCTNVELAAEVARTMSTQERVERFGTPGIKQQLGSLLLEDFQQEFEVVYSDETLTFFPYTLIKNCTDAELELATDFAELDEHEGRLIAGFDVGRRRDLSVLAVVEERRSKDGKSVRFITRMLKSYDKVPFREQEADLRLLLNTLPIARLSIDNNGLGMMLAENLTSEFPGKVVPEEFTTPNKEMWCTDFKIALQRKGVVLPADRDLTAQIHSIKKNVTNAGRVTFETEKDAKTKGHADKFWALALACQKERTEAEVIAGVGVRIIGEEDFDAEVTAALVERVRVAVQGPLVRSRFATDEEYEDALEEAAEAEEAAHGGRSLLQRVFDA